jgi:Uma2 family endonuclease
MRTAPYIPVEEYLHSCYRPDCDYVDGELLERNVGERDHSELQGVLMLYYYNRRKQLGVHPLMAQRFKISEQRYRVPDICLMRQRPAGQIVTEPPLAIIEVLSPEDRMSRMQSKIQDYLGVGVKYVWVIDPQTRRAEIYTRDGSQLAKDGVLRTADPPTELPLSEIFAEIDGL